MTRESTPRCPKCGSSEVQFVSEHEDDPGSFLGSATPQRTTTRLYRCPCGMAFTESGNDGGGNSQSG